MYSSVLEALMKKRAMLVANSASMIDHFNRDNIAILQSMQYEITVTANFRDGNSSSSERVQAFRRELNEQHIDVLDLPIPRKVTQLGRMLKSVFALKKYLKKNPCDIIHTQTPFGGVVGRLAAKKARKSGQSKVIYFVHGFHFYKGAKSRKSALYYMIEKHLSRYTDCLITLNQEDYTAGKVHFRHPNIRYVPGIGVNTDAIRNMQVDEADKRARLGLPSGKPVILNVSELIPRKNIAASIEAFSKMKNKNCVLVICGKGQERDKLLALCETLAVTDRVYFLGYRTDILEIYRLADIFLFTSFQEGLPVGVMQAMAAGLPVIASDIRGNRDLLGQSEGTHSADYLVDVHDTQAFADKLDSLLSHPETRHLLGEENVCRCRKYFDIAIVHEQMQAIYRELKEQLDSEQNETERG